MDKSIDARFERVEKALSALVDSITKYNPSVSYANELADAERELNKGLEERMSPLRQSHLCASTSPARV